MSEQSEDIAHAMVLSIVQEQRTSSRYKKSNPRRPAFRLLSGGQRIVICPACFAVPWGWKERKTNQ